MDLGWQRFGDAPFEWVQSTQGPNVYEEYLKAHGEGFHHLGVDVKDMDAAIKILEGKGAPPSQGGGWDTPQSKGRFAYLDTDPHGGVTLELLWDQPR
jgi:4-hydroxyphenylpyruvate dioxygenase-like putative hemolysin